MKLLRWQEREMDGQGYIDWYPFDHPQLGRIELGGWNKLAMFRNPPPRLREREVARFPGWLTWQALTLPRLEPYSTEVTRLGDDTWRVRVAVQNTGYLPSYVTKRALERKLTRGVVFEVVLPAGASLVSGRPRIEGAQLEGRANKVSLQAFLPNPEITGDRTPCEWTVRAPRGTQVSIVARHDRAGRVEMQVPLA